MVGRERIRNDKGIFWIVLCATAASQKIMLVFLSNVVDKARHFRALKTPERYTSYKWKFFKYYLHLSRLELFFERQSFSRQRSPNALHIQIC